MKTYQEHFEASCALRDELWKSIGTVDPYVLAPMLNPAFMGGPRWPSLRQAFTTVQTADTTIIASDGLSDPYDDMDTNPKNAKYNGLGLEVYLVTEKLPGGVQASWQFGLLNQAAQLLAQQGNVISLLEELTYISTELYDVEVPEEFMNEDGRVGVLFGLPDDKIPGTLQLTLEPVKMVNVKLLTLAELNYIVENGEKGRNEVAELLIKQGNATLSSLTRASVI